MKRPASLPTSQPHPPHSAGEASGHVHAAPVGTHAANDTRSAPPIVAHDTDIEPEDTVFAFGPFRLIPAQRLLEEDNNPVRLGGRAFDLLLALVRRAGDIIGKDELITAVWRDLVIDESGLRVQMAALRKALGEHRTGVRHIATVSQRGYSLVTPVRRLQLSLTAPAYEEILRPAVPVRASLGTLPTVLTRIIGRDEAVDAVIRTLPTRRFVSLVGPGGMGKTTTALVAAARLAPAYQDGAFFVDLGALPDAERATEAVATALGMRTHTADSLQDIGNWVASKSMLIVLDNCEHVIAAAAAMVEFLLGQSPGIHVLATSREPLRAQGEWVQRLASLAIPVVTPQTSFETALSYPAFELFVERATANSDSVRFGDADVASIARLCTRLDGIPLAIELVAARAENFSLSSLTAALDNHLPLPTLGLRTALPRHQTLQATLDWSYALLQPSEQRLLRRLAIFRERFVLASAIAIDVDDGLNAESTLMATHESEMALMNLIAKSLVAAEKHDGEMQYRLLETTRAYAARALAASGELHEVSRRHALLCHRWLLRAAADFDVLLPAHWRMRYARSIDDVRAALTWSAGPDGDPQIEAMLTADSASLWFGIGAVQHYLGAVEKVMAQLPAAATGTSLEMRLLLAFGQTSIAMHGAVPQSRAALVRCIDIAQSLGDSDYQLRAHWGVFAWETYRGNHAAAHDAVEAFGAVARASHDERHCLAYHRVKAVCLQMLGQLSPALKHLRQALTPAGIVVRQLHGSPFQFDHRTAVFTQLSRILWLQGHADQAAAAVRDAIDTATTFDDALSLTYALAYAACPVSLWRGDLVAARRYIDMLKKCAESNGLMFWASWARLYDQVLRAREGATGLTNVDDTQLQISLVDMLPTLSEGYLSPLVLHRTSTGMNLWCVAEVMRVSADRVRAARPDQTRAAEASLRQALKIARDQGAHAWILRTSTSLARLLHEDGRHVEAQRALAGPLAAVTEGFDTADVIAATQLAETLRRNSGQASAA
ncbi:ATP-binding protein [Pigmentiphaga aceris]|uniref:ATP-binding protein n=1 Tax=Pigmentiphaga aceris TaxID=1940612 RepID=UPI001652AB0A|nr:winged helix-turn-helix domain-containing protein [Pigmentiphaga aceris]